MTDMTIDPATVRMLVEHMDDVDPDWCVEPGWRTFRYLVMKQVRDAEQREKQRDPVNPSDRTHAIVDRRAYETGYLYYVVVCHECLTVANSGHHFTDIADAEAIAIAHDRDHHGDGNRIRG